ncbi:MAG: ATP-binding protein [Cyanobacteria bacterium P01_A01_bin.84]
MTSNFITLDKGTYYSLQKELLELRQQLNTLHKKNCFSDSSICTETEKLTENRYIPRRISGEIEEKFQQMQLFIEQIPIPIAMFDCDMKCLVASGRWLEESNIQNQNHEVFLDVYQFCLQEVAEVSQTASFINRNGETYSCRWKANPWYDDSGYRAGVIISYKITGLHKQVEENLCNQKLQSQVQELETSLKNLQDEQIQLIQTEKMNSISQMSAGLAHEINNPISFLHGNIPPIIKYIQDILGLVEIYQRFYPEPKAEIEVQIEDIDLEFIRHDLSKILLSMEVGTKRIQGIVLSLKNFSRLDESGLKRVDIHEGIDSTLMILRHRLNATEKRSEILAIADYGKLPAIECYPSQLNQVFMNLIGNAIDVFDNDDREEDTSRVIIISSELINDNWVTIRIQDNGCGIPANIKSKLFEPFFTTKEIGEGMGIGLSLSYQIVVKNHGGKLHCNSTFGQGTQFIIEIPVNQT